MTEYTIVATPVRPEDIRKRACVNCGHNIRVKNEKGMVEKCVCDYNGQWIGYVQTFEGWCRHWKKDRSRNERTR